MRHQGKAMLAAAEPYRLPAEHRRTSQAEGTADVKSQSQEITWVITAHAEGGTEDVGGEDHGTRSRTVVNTMLRSLIFGL